MFKISPVSLLQCSTRRKHFWSSLPELSVMYSNILLNLVKLTLFCNLKTHCGYVLLRSLSILLILMCSCKESNNKNEIQKDVENISSNSFLKNTQCHFFLGLNIVCSVRFVKEENKRNSLKELINTLLCYVVY